MTDTTHFQDRLELIRAYGQPEGTVTRYVETEATNCGYLKGNLRKAYTNMQEVVLNYKMWSQDKDNPGNSANLALGLELIIEEFFELMNAITMEEPDENVLKEACDLGVVVEGMCHFLGYDYDEARKRIHDSNLSKLGDDGKPVKNSIGKVVKGPNYEPPVLEDLI